MSATNAFENGLLSLIFQNANYGNVGDAGGLRGALTAGVHNVSLHTGDPGEAGTQSTSETTYPGYARITVARDVSNWAVASGTADNIAAITYGTCSSGGATLTNFGIGHSASGAGTLHIKGALTSPLSVSTGITPSFAPGALDITLE